MRYKTGGYIVAPIFNGLLWSWGWFTLFIDYIGRASILKDLQNTNSTVSQILRWVLDTPWWVPSLLAAILTIAIIIVLLRHSTPSSITAHNMAQAKEIPSAFLDAIERLCAEEHEASLRAYVLPAQQRTHGGATNLSVIPDPQRFRSDLMNLDPFCGSLGLRATRDAIRDSLNDMILAPNDSGHVHRQFNNVSRSLKNELSREWRLVRIP
jgi:hypothetical protein